MSASQVWRRCSGNVILEIAVAILAFGVLLLPVASAVSTIAAARRMADGAVFEVARVWTVTSVENRLSEARTAAALLASQASLPLRITVSCTRACTDLATRVLATATVDTGVPLIGQIRARQELTRDAYAP